MCRGETNVREREREREGGRDAHDRERKYADGLTDWKLSRI